MRQTHQQMARFQPSWKLLGLRPWFWPCLLDGPCPHTPAWVSHGGTPRTCVICPCLLPFLWHHSQSWRSWLAQTPFHLLAGHLLGAVKGGLFPTFLLVFGVQDSAHGWDHCLPSLRLTCPQRAAGPRTLTQTKGTARKQIQEDSNNLHKTHLP